MNRYICKYGLYHDKPVKVIEPYLDKEDRVFEPSSNNGWIYTALAVQLKVLLGDYSKLEDVHNKCLSIARDDKLYYCYRLPTKILPPLSRDEAIGMISLGFDPFMYRYWLSRPQKGSLINAFKILWSIRNEHRNTVWEKTLKGAYRIAFKLAFHDRYYVDVITFKKTKIHYWLFFQLYAFTTIIQRQRKTGKISAQNVLWLQLRDLNSKFWIRFIDIEDNLKHYFPKDHPFNNRYS